MDELTDLMPIGQVRMIIIIICPQWQDGNFFFQALYLMWTLNVYTVCLTEFSKLLLDDPESCALSMPRGQQKMTYQIQFLLIPKREQLPFTIPVIYNTWNTQDCVWPHFQTQRRELKIWHTAEYLWRTSQSLLLISISIQTLPQSQFPLFKLDELLMRIIINECGRRGALMVSVLNSGSSGPGSRPGQVHCVVFMGKTLNSHSASFHPGFINGYQPI